VLSEMAISHNRKGGAAPQGVTGEITRPLICVAAFPKPSMQRRGVCASVPPSPVGHKLLAAQHQQIVEHVVALQPVEKAHAEEPARCKSLVDQSRHSVPDN
jgi:hypothetical protein